MRLWSIHPRCLDVKGLCGLWREALLAQKVILNQTKGWRNHPQLERFKNHESPLVAVGYYLVKIHEEAEHRGYSFNKYKIVRPTYEIERIELSRGQLVYEYEMLKDRMEKRDPKNYSKLLELEKEGLCPEPHPLFVLIEGDVEPWEMSHWRSRISYDES